MLCHVCVCVYVYTHESKVFSPLLLILCKTMPTEFSLTYPHDTEVFRGALLVDVATHGEACGAVLLLCVHLVTPRHRHVVDDPETAIIHINVVDEHDKNERFGLKVCM